MNGPSWLPSSTERRRLFLGLWAFRLAAPAEAAPLSRYELRAVVATDSAAARQIFDAFSAHYPGLIHDADPRALARRPGAGAYLAIGPTALQAALDAELRAPLVSLFTSQQTFQRVLASGAGARARVGVSAIFAEASPEDQLALIAALYQRRVTVGVLLSEATAALEPLLKRAARRLDLEIAARRIAPRANVVQELTALSGAAVILALPDSNVFSADNLRVVLESTYRRGKPLIGFSPALVAAGTLATAYASVDDVIAHLDLLLAAIDAGQAPEPQFPQFWRVAVNESVARSLDVVITDEVRSLGNRSRRK